MPCNAKTLLLFGVVYFTINYHMFSQEGEWIMLSIRELLEKLTAGEWDDRLKRVYCTGDPSQAKQRIANVTAGYCATFGADDSAQVEIFSAPGRTEIGGNHTDHQHGCVLAGSVNLDTLCCAAPNGTSVVRMLSEGYPMLEVDISDLTPVKAEENTSYALIRGVAARMTELGCPVGGFDAYATSNVLAGSGLSSSAAYEVLLGVIFNRLFCGERFDAVQIAQIGQYAENVFFGKPCGLMDQMASSVGNVVAIDFNDPAAPVIRPIGFDFAASGYALCIIDSGADHANLTDEYAAIPADMKNIARALGVEVLRDADEAKFIAAIPELRKQFGDRAVLRAYHFFGDNRRAVAEADLLEKGDFAGFMNVIKESGRSSFQYLQNVYVSGAKQDQAVALSLAVAEMALAGEGAVRVHGGGFAGTIQAFVPQAKLDSFVTAVDAALGEGACHVLAIRPEGGITLIQ